jgi:hypothetical protein
VVSSKNKVARAGRTGDPERVETERQRNRAFMAETRGITKMKEMLAEAYRTEGKSKAQTLVDELAQYIRKLEANQIGA